MRTNESKLTGRRALFIALGTMIGFLGIETFKVLANGMSFANSIVNILTDAFGRAVCVILVFGLYCLLTKNNK